jgi:hypothetical protein
MLSQYRPVQRMPLTNQPAQQTAGGVSSEIGPRTYVCAAAEPQDTIPGNMIDSHTERRWEAMRMLR